jgi:hypothetical protein
MPRQGTTQLPVCVLGMGRSGTSLTARVIGMLGIDLGSSDTMLPPHAQDNKHGYWEQGAIQVLNDDVLAALGGTWYRPPLLEEGWHHAARLDPFKQRAREVLERHFAGSSRWGWKDPRTTLTLPLWREIVGDMVYVICFRNPAEVADSLLRRDPVAHPREDTFATWLRYSGESLRNTAGERRILVSFEDWFDRPQQQLERLATFLSDGTATVPRDSRDEALAFLDRGARHHTSQMTQVEADETIPADVRLFQLSLRHLVAERSGVELDIGLRVLEEWWAARDRPRHERDRLRLEVAELDLELERHRDWLAAVQSSLSWRGTKPLRRAKRKVLSLRHQAGEGTFPR